MFDHLSLNGGKVGKEGIKDLLGGSLGSKLGAGLFAEQVLGQVRH
jgi:hypothetical protein